MEEQDIAGGERTAATWQVEVAVAGALALVALLVLADSWRIGIGWGAEGPQAGFFPFYVGLILLAASATTLVANLLPSLRDGANFVERTALRRVLAVLLPTVAYVVLVRWLGIYVASALLILFFMRVHGRHAFATAAAVALGVPVALFALFELWFLVPLPKGPLETALGF